MRRTKEQKVFDDVFNTFYEIATRLPWYVDIILATLFYFLFHYLFLKYPIGGNFEPWMFVFSILFLILQYFLPAIFITGGIASAWHSFQNRLRGKELIHNPEINKATEIVSKMNWLDFEIFIGEWFRTQGYEVSQAGGADTGIAHADGGIDIELHKNGELFIVQCKHYRAWKVPVEVIRDLYGVMTARGAVGGFVVTSGLFTEPAIGFASGRSITLIDGQQLVKALQNTLKDKAELKGEVNVEADAPNCPLCSSEMVLRTAHRGENSGNEFWGCSQYPNCKGIVSLK